MENLTNQNSKKILVEMFILIFLLAIFHIGALSFGWYVKFWWWDVMNHFLGGFFISIGIYWIIKYRNYLNFVIKKDGKSFSQFLTVITITMFIAVFWEVYEYSLGFRNYPEGYVFDTAKDIAMGFLGGISGFLYFIIRRFNKVNEK